MKKRILSMILALVMVLGMFPVTAFAVEEVPALPTATVTEISVTEPRLTFALNFKADAATDEQLAYYGGWYADFVLTVNKDVTFNANGGADGYLAGQYDEWSENWVSVPFENVPLTANTPLKIMEYAADKMGKPGLKYTYAEVYDVVKDFDCGVFFETEFLKANPDLKVTLELRMYNPENEDESYVIGDTYIFTLTNYSYNISYYADAEKTQPILVVENYKVPNWFWYEGIHISLFNDDHAQDINAVPTIEEAEALSPGAGYRFAGWSLDGVKLDFPVEADDANDNLLLPKGGKNIDLIAMWEKEYTVTFYPAGQTTAPITSQAGVREGDTLAQTAPDKEGTGWVGKVYLNNFSSGKPEYKNYHWSGKWYCLNDAGKKVYIDHATTPITADLANDKDQVIVWPEMNPNPYVRFYKYGMTTAPSRHFQVPPGMSVAEFNPEAQMPDIKNAGISGSKTGYHPTYWYYLVDGVETQYALDVVVNGNMSVFPKFEPNNYTITFDSNGGYGEMAPQDFIYDEAQALNPNAFKRNGYQFAGWKTEDGQTYGDQEEVSMLASEDGATVTLYAQWEKATITFTVDPNGGQFSDGSEDPIEATAEYLSKYTLPVITREGYSIFRWMVDELPASNVDTDILFIGDWNGLTIYPEWTPNRYTITFDSNGGSDVEDITAEYLSTVNAPEAPTKKNYEFLGWVDADGNEVKFPLTMPLDGMELTAKWKLMVGNVHIYIYNSSDLTTPVAQDKIDTMVGDVIDLSTLKIEDYYSSTYGFEMVGGWFNDGRFNEYVAGKNPAGMETMEVTGAWQNIKAVVTDLAPVVVKAVVNGDKENAETIFSGKALKGEDLTAYLEENVVVEERTGYTMDKWYNWDWYGHKLGENATVNGWTNVYVTYTANTYTIRYNAGEGKYTGSEPNRGENWMMLKNAYTYDAPVTLYDGTDFEREGWTLIGWTIGDTTYDLGETVEKNFTHVAGGTVQAYAVWTPNQTQITDISAAYKVEHYQENLDGTYTLVDEEFPLFAKLGETVTAEAKTYEGFTFANVEDAVVEMPKDPAEGETMPSFSTVKVYYTRNEYTITFNTDGGSAVAPITADYLSTVEAPTAPTKENHKFLGWFDAEGNEVTFPLTMPLGGMELTAKWEILTVEYIFHADWNDEIKTVTYNRNDNVTLPAADYFTRTGYKLTGWSAYNKWGNAAYTYVPGRYIGDDYSKAAASCLKDGTRVEGEVHFYAQWAPITYTIKYNAGEGTYTGSLPNSKPEWLQIKNGYTYNAPVTLYDGTDFVREGWTLIGWTIDDTTYDLGETVEKNFTSVQNGTVQAYAVWTPNQTQITDIAAAYKVEHYQENLDGTYTLVEEEFPLFAKVGETVTAEAKTYKGFTLDKVDGAVVEMPKDPIEGETMPSFSTVRAYYTRNEYAITVEANEGGEVKITNLAGEEVTEGTFGETLVYSIVPNIGYKVVKAELQYQGQNGPVKAPLKDAGNLRMPAADVTVVVEFEPVSYKIIFDGNGGLYKGNSTITSKTIAYDEPFTSYYGAWFTREDYSFTGWNTESDGSGTPYADGVLMNLTAVDGDVVTLYAQWERVAWDITNEDEFTFEFEKDHTYNGEAHKPEVTVLFNGEPLAAENYTVTYGENINAGEGTIVVTGTGVAGEGYYGEVELTFTIKQAKATITAVNASKTYGEADPALYATVEGAVEGETLNYTVAREAGEDAGKYAIIVTVKPEENPNYDITTVDGEFEILPAPIEVTAYSYSKLYGKADPKFAWKVTKGKLLNGFVPSGELSCIHKEVPGTYPITQGTLDFGGNYAVTFKEGTLTIKLAPGQNLLKENKCREPFVDVEENDWFHDDVEYVYVNGIMNGVSADEFAPNGLVNRAMVVTTLWRLEGSPEVANAPAFTDVAGSEWYAKAVAWAAAKGIVNGMGDGTFAPLDAVTREQVAAMLNRYADFKGWKVEAKDTEAYIHSAWSAANVDWADTVGLFDGLGVNVTDLTKSANRAELAAYLTRFMENVAK